MNIRCIEISIDNQEVHGKEGLKLSLGLESMRQRLNKRLETTFSTNDAEVVSEVTHAK